MLFVWFAIRFLSAVYIVWWANSDFLGRKLWKEERQGYSVFVSV